MKKFLILLAMGAAVFLGGCGTERIDAGHVGIKVNLYGSDKGVDDVTVVTGRVWYNPATTEVHEVPTFMQNAVWTSDKREGSKTDQSITFQTNEGLETRANIALNYNLDPDKVPALFKKFRKDPLTLQDTYLRTQVRNIFVTAASKYSIEDFIQNKDQFLNDVMSAAKAKLGPEGFIVDTLTFIGSPKYPASVVGAIQNKIKATQVAEQKKRELAQSEADAKKLVAKTEGEAKARIAEARGKAEAKLLAADAEAKAIRKVTAALNNQYVDYIKAQQWDGKLPTVSAGNGADFLIDVRGK